MNCKTFKTVICKFLLVFLAFSGLMLVCSAAQSELTLAAALGGEVLILMGINILLGVLEEKDARAEKAGSRRAAADVQCPPQLRVVRGGKAA